MNIGTFESSRIYASGPPPAPGFPYIITFENYEVGATSGTGDFDGTWNCYSGASVQLSSGTPAETYPKCIYQSAAAFGSSPIFTDDLFGWDSIEENSGFNFRIYAMASNYDTGGMNISCVGSIINTPSIDGDGSTIKTGIASLSDIDYPYSNFARWYRGVINGGFGTTGWIELYKLEIYET